MTNLKKCQIKEMAESAAEMLEDEHHLGEVMERVRNFVTCNLFDCDDLTPDEEEDIERNMSYVEEAMFKILHDQALKSVKHYDNKD